MFYASSLFALGSVVILYNVKETLLETEKFRPHLLKVKRNEIFEKTALLPAITTVLLCFSIGTVLTIAPDLSEHLGLHNKG
ncbi:hypothetical protein ABTD22_20530, partial [Acinetobacter baumannii]